MPLRSVWGTPWYSPSSVRFLVVAFAHLHHDVVEHVIEFGRQGVERLADHPVESVARDRVHQR